MNDKQYLRRALGLAEQSPEPVGCGVVLVQRGKVIAEAFNSQRADNRATNHAEMKAINAANKKLNARKLLETTAYCSCEPCAMCLTALSYAGIERIVFVQRMKDLFPQDPQSRLNSQRYVKRLNFVPQLEQIKL